MKIVGTLMVRDEVDVVAAMVEHHLDQGLDLIVVTDNGSVDGTTEVLQEYATTGLVELHHDPVHRKQQSVVVTGMARRARTEHAADWVLNLDADEFWVPVDKSLTLRQALERIPLALNAFTVPVTNLVGSTSADGPWLHRLVHRDLRTEPELHGVGVHAHPTADAVHRGESDVVVAQGNHFVSLVSNGQPDDAVALEVLHVPWRSWAQVERKVVQAGRAYESNPDLRPSPNHHGMADYRRHVAGRLKHLHALRLPPQAALDEGAARGSFSPDTWLRDHLLDLLADGRARRPELLRPLTTPTASDVDADEHARLAEVGVLLVSVEQERALALVQASETKQLARRLARQRDDARSALERSRADVRALRGEVRALTRSSTVTEDARGLAARVVRASRRRVGRVKRLAGARARAATGRRSLRRARDGGS